MRQKAECRDCLRNAELYVDNALSPAESAAVLAHAKDCLACRADIAGLQALSRGIRQQADYHAAPPELGMRLRKAVAARASRRDMGWKNFVLPTVSAAALALSLLLWLSAPVSQDTLLDDVVSIHVRALQENHLMDVASTDQHTVKPWFAGRIDFSPPVHDFAAQGYPLVGGRLDYLGHKTAAALVYRHNKHVINIIVTPDAAADAPLAAQSRRGYNLVTWRSKGLSFDAVSDLNGAELMELCKFISSAQ